MRLFPCALLAALFVLNTAPANGQDRVILFESGYWGFASAPAEIREFAVTEKGRSWSLLRRVTLPGHQGHSPVALADGSRILWLARRDVSSMAVLALLTNETVGGRRHFMARDMTTLALVFGSAPVTSGDWQWQENFSVALTPNEGTVLMYTTYRDIYDTASGCPFLGARVDVFDGQTYVHAHRVDVRGQCSAVIPLPSR